MKNIGKAPTAVFLLALFVPIGFAQDAPTTGDSSIPFKVWEAAIPGGNYLVKLDHFSSVTVSEYIANSTTRVYEVNISAVGSALARFYYLEPVTDKSPLNVGQVVVDRVKQITEEGGDRTGLSDVYKKVVKDYPNTTHAHTVEFRLASLDELLALHESARKAFLSGKGRKFSITFEE